MSEGQAFASQGHLHDHLPGWGDVGLAGEGVGEKEAGAVCLAAGAGGGYRAGTGPPAFLSLPAGAAAHFQPL